MQIGNYEFQMYKTSGIMTVRVFPLFLYLKIY